MALPKRRQSKSRGRKRSTQYKSSPVTISKCRETGEVYLRHRAYYHNGVLYYKGNPISIELPNFVELRVTQTDPGLKGDTAQGGLKKAIMDTGLQVNVPLFINEGELLKIDTRTGEYVERVKG